MPSSSSPELLGVAENPSARNGGRLAMLVGTAVLAVGLLALVPLEETRVGDIAEVDQRQSALLDGPALQRIVESRVAAVSGPRSTLLDGPMLQATIEATIATGA